MCVSISFREVLKGLLKIISLKIMNVSEKMIRCKATLQCLLHIKARLPLFHAYKDGGREGDYFIVRNWAIVWNCYHHRLELF